MRGAGQIEYLTKLAEPDVAVVVNAGTAHIELLGSTDAIAAGEGRDLARPARRRHGRAPGRRRRGSSGWARAHRPHARHVTFGEVDAPTSRLVELRADSTPAASSQLDVFGERHELDARPRRHATPRSTRAPRSPPRTPPAPRSTQALAGLARARPPAMRGEVVEVARPQGDRRLLQREPGVDGRRAAHARRARARARRDRGARRHARARRPRAAGAPRDRRARAASSASA